VLPDVAGAARVRGGGAAAQPRVPGRLLDSGCRGGGERSNLTKTWEIN
jgi:hypothetical protein